MSSEAREIVEYPREDLAVRDGIGEEDNPVPLWFNIGFYGLIAFGVVYILFYTLSGWSQRGQYEAEVAAAAERAQAAQAEQPTQNPYRGNAAGIAEGQAIFAANCVACHKPDASGLVGPSLVDPYWKYGSSDHELFETVSKGRPGGMPPWGPVLGREKIWKVLAYLATLPRSDKPGVGAPDFQPPAG
jgi:cytochrome c oxidase cbb3-type subunit III